MRRLFALSLCLLLLAGLVPFPAFADGETVTIGSAEEFLRFSENCARESYSLGRHFLLTADLDLTDLPYEAAAYFAGAFDGQGHRIVGLAIHTDGSRQGLFRQISPDGSLANLSVEGSVLPGGSREYIGGLVGYNEGSIQNCRFSGEVNGIGFVGGIAGCNSETGTLRSCSFSGSLIGEHQAGGIAGQNDGLLENCESSGQINTVAFTPSGERHFDLATLSQDEFVDISNIAGIAGENSGTVRNCRNTGAVGYRYTGYNVGGIVGKSSGFVDSCENSGDVEGRRDTGGIVGQSIPYSAWEFTNEKLEELRNAISYMHYLLDTTNQNLEGGRAYLASQLLSMDEYADQARLALEKIAEGILTPGTYPSWGSIGTGEFSSALNNMNAIALSMVRTVGTSADILAEDVKNISLQMGYILNLLFATVSQSTDDLITRKDLSLDEAYEHDEAAVANCINRGAVRAETNAGGIVGTIGFEVEFDMEDRLNASGTLTSHAEQSLFAVIRTCENRGDIFCRGDNVGGIVGRVDIGAVVDCVSRGHMQSQNGDYVGGIAGTSQGSVARCWSRSALEGRRYLGGIAGLGEDLLENRAWTKIQQGSEYLGAVAGWAEGLVQGNLYADSRPDGVDGVSRIGQADAVSSQSLLELSGAPEDFGTVTVRFVVGEQTLQILQLPFGGGVEQMPAVANRDRSYWEWEEKDLSHVYSDTTVNGSFYSPNLTISSGEAVPLFLAEGEFYENQTLRVTPCSPPEGIGEVLAAYTLRVEDYDGMLTLRMRSSPEVRLFRLGSSGEQTEISFETDGQYLLFTVPNGSSIVSVRHREFNWRLLIVAAAVLLETLLLLVRAGIRKRRKRRNKPAR